MNANSNPGSLPDFVPVVIIGAGPTGIWPAWVSATSSPHTAGLHWVFA